MFQRLKSFAASLTSKPQDKIEKALNLPEKIKSAKSAETKQYADHPCPDYMGLKLAFRDTGRLNAIIETLGRDFLTAMPEGAYISRLGQIAFLYRQMHQTLSEPSLIEKLSGAKDHMQNSPQDWDEWDQANLREIETAIRHHAGVPADLIEKRARLMFEGRHVHRDALKNNDWENARTFLEGVVELHQKIADAKQLTDNDHPESRYQSLLREYIPGARIDDIDALFDGYRQELDTLIPQILSVQETRPQAISMQGVFSAKSQMWLNREMLRLIGFDFDRGGLYETGHNPVEGGTPDDTRLVMKTAKIGTFLDSLKSALHEGGHGIYIQGLPRKQWRYQPIGQDLGALVHESQALLIEMILGRKREFFDYISPRAEGVFQRFNDPALTSENLWLLKNSVSKTIDRKSADEVTYFLHIQMRTDIERQLISGELKVKDLPDAWNTYSRELFGKKPKTYAEGCLQDVHWFVGKFGYFPSYALGHMMAAQLYNAITRDIPHMPAQLRSGDFTHIHRWLQDKIYTKGRLKRTNDLLTDITGEPLTYNPLVKHIKNRYLNT
jgi:carboxypeptidase Taq